MNGWGRGLGGRSRAGGHCRICGGLLAGLERNNGWTLAEHAGEISPDGMQRLLRKAGWDAGAVRDDLRDYVAEHLGDPGAVLIVDDAPARGHWVLARRRLSDGERACYICYGPARTTLDELITVAGTRWAIGECFQAARNETGLDNYQARTYGAWYRHITLSMAAHAYLAATAAQKGTQHLRATTAGSR